VEGKGIVLIVGCGHQTIDRVIKRTNEVLDIPIYGLIGGLHYPVRGQRDHFPGQKMLGTGKLPWQRIREDEVEATIARLRSLNISLIGISAHDSCDWTLEKFKDSFQDIYREVVVGKEILI
jgi:7,8-dihydropterin-6-yl-methyl-4-(beta-D-ribofuranosyl)aminobenzene 5'-phosphate synthase